MGPNCVSEFVLKVTDLIYKYPGQKKPALNKLSLLVPNGSIFGIVGPNGGGKSTTFKILSTLILPQQGTVELWGIDLLKNPGKVRSLLGVVFQAPALDKKLTVEENLFHQGHLYGMRGKILVERTEFLLKRLGLWEKRDEKTENLSGGQKRRLEITKSLLHHPKMLILDEPTTGLDPLARKEVWNYLKFLREKEQMTILVTTHLLEEAEDCDEIALIDKGKVICHGKPSTLRHDLGGNLVSVRTLRAKNLAEKISKKFSPDIKDLGQEIRIQPNDISSFLDYLIKDCANDFDSFTVGKPTLEDLFIEKTGHKFWDENEVTETGVKE